MKTFLKKRFDKGEFVGLPLTVIVATILLIIATFTGLAEVVTSSGPVTALDTSVTQFLFTHRTPFFDQFFYTVTQFGSLKVVGILIPVVIVALFVYKKRDLLLPLIISLVGSELAMYFIKLGIHRPRPGESVAYYLEKSYSFPSGHATIAMAFYGFLIYFFVRLEGRLRSSYSISLVLSLLIFLIGFSRIYLGVHYLSDVLGGYLVGGMWLLLAISLREILGWRKSKLV